MRGVGDAVDVTAGDTAGSAVSTLLTLAGVASQEPSLTVAAVPLGAFAGGVTEQGVDLVRQIWRDRKGRLDRFASSASIGCGTAVEDLIAKRWPIRASAN